MAPNVCGAIMTSFTLNVGNLFSLLRARGVKDQLQQTDDVFYLKRDEMSADAESFTTTVIGHGVFRDQHKRLALPVLVPPATDALWVQHPLVKTMAPAQREAMFGCGIGDRYGKRVLVGFPSNPGHAEGIARMISGPHNFARFNQGDILVADSKDHYVPLEQLHDQMRILKKAHLVTAWLFIRGERGQDCWPIVGWPDGAIQRTAAS